MAPPGENDLQSQSVDAALQQWRQGDCVLGEQWFVHRFDPEVPLTKESAAVAGEGLDLAESAVRGFVVLTQSCDIVRKSLDRPFIEVAPIVEVSEQYANEIERGWRPLYAIIPALRPYQLVADLDRTMTVEKAVIARWLRIVGCRTDDEVRKFSQDLARKRARSAFPNDFIEFVKKLRSRVREKHDKPTEEGRALRALREIRVHAAPSWDASEVRLTFWFIRREDEIDFEAQRWISLLAA